MFNLAVEFDFEAGEPEKNRRKTSEDEQPNSVLKVIFASQVTAFWKINSLRRPG